MYLLLVTLVLLASDAAGATVPPSSGDPSGTQTVPAGAVVEQYVWSPYGELLSRDVLDRTTLQLMTDAGAARPASGNDPGSPGTAGASLAGIRNKVGHQGLFFERFDGVNTDPALVPTDATAIATNAPAGRGKGFYYNRWRWYDAQSGRFVSEDMNGAGMAGSQSLAFHGEALDVSIEPFSGMTQYGDGLSLFAYLASSPLMGTDALGLESWDEDIDDAIADRTGHAMYSLATLNEAASWASIGLQTTLSIARGFLPGSGLYDAFKAVQVLSSGGGGFWEALDIASAALPMISAGRQMFGAMSGIGRAKSWAYRACANSFVAGTLILTPASATPIEALRVGEWVLSRHETSAGEVLVPRRVTNITVGGAREILWLTFADGTALGATSAHELWTVDRGGIPACEVVAGDRLALASGSTAEIVDVTVDSAPTAVFNLEVAGSFTYFAEGVWVHNNSCPLHRPLWRNHGGASHTQAGFEIMQALIARGIPVDKIRWNQALMKPGGKHYPGIRPDVQWIENGKVHVIEVVHTRPPAPGRRAQIEQALGADFGSYKVQPVTGP